MRLEVLPDRTCALAPFQRELLVEKPLDALLASVADSCGARGLAVVLTGMGRDGAAGARTLRAAGGAVIVQSAASAAYAEMPRAAAEAGAADLVLPLADIGRAVIDLMAGGRFPHPRNEAEAREALFAGAGEARAALRAVEWSATPPGNVRGWPQSLKAIVATMLHSRFPTCIFWGPEFVQVYNDAWIAVLGANHPAAAGVPARATWSEIWAGQVAGYRSVLQTGLASYAEDQLFAVRRHGSPEEAYFTVSHSPVHDDQGVVQGVMTIATETTERVLAARRQGALRALASAGGAETTAAACGKAADVLAEIPRDVPFALVYVCDLAQLRATLQAAVGLRGGAALAPHTIELSNATAPWPLGKVLRQRSSLVLHDLAARLRGFHAGPWPEAPVSAILLPLWSDGDAGGVLVAGLSPRLPLDAACRDFLELLGRQMATNLAAARLRESERERIAKLAELDRTRTEFFSNVSHEFRTPLTLILGPLEDLLAAPGPETGPLHRDLEVASRNARRLLNLVDTLLDFSQIEAGRLRARFRDIDLAAHTSDIAGLFRSAAERARLQFEIDCAPLPGPVRVDPDMWEKIVSNLLSNALKFTFDGGIAVRLRHLGQHVQLEVADTGVGIPQDQLPHVFQRFHRVRGTRARTEEGAGIGLALVHELVQLHHGRIRVRSDPGRGSIFTVWIPQAGERMPAAPQADAAAPSTHGTALQLAGDAERWSGTARPGPPVADVVESMLGPASTGLPAHAAGARVLVVDDNADMREYLARTLGGHWNIIQAADGEEALRLARAERPHLVLADVMMPGLDGFGLLRGLRADDELKATPLVLVTARAHEEAAIEGLLAGADDYIAKPFSSRELVARVGAQLELARVRRQGERRVRELLALVPVGVYACDTAGNFEYFNRTAVELWGREPERDDHWWAFCGAPRALLPDGGWLQPDDSPMAEVLRTGQAVRDRELTIVRADGARIELQVHIRPLHEDGRLAGAVCAFQDATARKQAERSLKTLNEELEERVEERTAALRASEERQAFLLELSDALRASRGEPAMVQTCVRSLAAHLHAGHCWISEHPHAELPEFLRRADSGAVVVPEFAGAQGATQPQLAPGVAAVIVVHLLQGGEAGTWALAVGSAAPRAWTREEVRLVQEVAERTWAAIERARGEAAAAQAERRAEGLIERMGDAHCVLDHQFRIVGVNAAAERVLGLPRGELLGRSHWEVFPGSVGAPVGRAFRRVVGEGLEQHLTHHYTGEGYDLHLELDAYPTEEGGVAMFWRDVTERVRAETALRASEEKYRALFNEMDEAYSVVEVLADGAGRWTDFRFLEVNPAFMRHTGMPYPVGRTAAELLGTPNPRWAELYGRAADTGESIRLEEGELTLGRVFDLNIFRLGGEGSRRVALFMDITERKRAQEALDAELAATRALHALSSMALDAPDGAAVLEAGLEVAMALHRADFGCVELYDAATCTLRIAAQRGFAPSLPDHFASAAARASSAGGAALAGRKRMVVADTEADPADAPQRDLARAAGYRAVQATPLVAASGEPLGVLSTHFRAPRRLTESEERLTDLLARELAHVIERTRVQAALRESEARYRTLFGSIDEGFCVIEMLFDHGGRPRDYRFLEANPAFVRQTGLADAVGRTMRELAPAHEPHWFDIYGNVAVSGEPVRFEAQAAQLGRWFDVYAFRIGEPPARRVALLFNDISARKAAEAAARESAARLASELRESRHNAPLTGAGEKR